ncbi:MAG: PAS domain-containing protein, partial [Tepidiformaceae bacterium]
MALTTRLSSGIADGLPSGGRATPAVPYLIATLAVGAVLLVKSFGSLSIGDEAPAILAIGPILLAAAVGGWRPGVYTTVLALAGVLAFYPPSGDGSRLTWGNLAFVLLFITEAALVVGLAEYTRRLVFRSRREAGRQATLAEIAELALANRDDRWLFEQAAERIADHLDADAAVVFARDASGRGIASRWPADAQTPSGDDEGYEFLRAACVTPGITLLSGESWTNAGRFLQSLGFVSGACTPIDASAEQPAFLAVFRRLDAPLRDSEQRYLETVAAVLGAARQRRAGEQALERSEERLRVAQAAANVGTWEWDLTTQQMSWSDGLEILHGLAPGTFPSSAAGYLDLVHADDRESVLTAATSAAAGERPFDVRYRIVLPGGQIRWVTARGQVFPAKAEKPPHIVGVVADVTQQMDVEQAVRESEERFRMMANAAPVLIRVANPSGACAFVNERWSAFVGRPAGSDLGWGWLDSVHPDDREACRTALVDSAARRAPAEIEYRIQDATADYRWVLDRTVPVEQRGGAFVAFVSSCTDITDRRRAEEALRFAADSGAQLSSSLDYEETLDGLARLAVPRFADWCVVFLKGDEGVIHRVSVVHRDPERAEAVERLAQLEALEPEGDSVAARVIRSGEPLLASDVEPTQLAAVSYNEEHLAIIRELGLRSVLAVPLTTHEEAVGAIVFLRGESGRNFHETDVTLALDLARRASVSIENARLYSDLVEREAAVARANETLTFLLDASAELARTLDLDVMMTRLAELATPRVADWCAILSLDGDGKPVVRAASHRDPRWQERVRELQERYPFNPRADGPVMRALSEAKPAFLPVVSDDLLRAGSVDQEHLAIIRRLSPRSAVIVPLAGTSTTYGAMYFVMSESGRSYTEDDFATLQDLAHRAAIAMDNATLFHEAQQ